MQTNCLAGARLLRCYSVARSPALMAGCRGVKRSHSEASPTRGGSPPTERLASQKSPKSTAEKAALAAHSIPPILSPPHLPKATGVWESGAVLLVDKPHGWTSFDVCAKVRAELARLLNRKPKNIKVGHAGTLDPLASGLLIICVGKATKSTAAFMVENKRYTGTMKLGEATPSLDSETEVSQTAPWEHVTDADLEKAAESFLGSQMQIPPMYSAITVNGRRLYESARKGKEVEREPRPITVDQLKLSREASGPQLIDFDVTCTKGTYIRSLADDLAKSMGTLSHLVWLRREASGEYNVESAWGMDSLIAEFEKLRKAKILDKDS